MIQYWVLSNIAGATFITTTLNSPTNNDTFENWITNRLTNPVLDGERVWDRSATFIQDQVALAEANREKFTFTYSGSGQQQLWFAQPILPTVTTKIKEYKIVGVSPANVVPLASFATDKQGRPLTYNGTNYRMTSIMAAMPASTTMNNIIIASDQSV